MRRLKWYHTFLILVLLLSIPFYIWGALSPVSGLPFGLPISFLMVFVPCGLSLYEAWKREKADGIKRLFRSILDVRNARDWALAASLLVMPCISLLAFMAQTHMSSGLPEPITVSYGNLPLMLLLYFLGAIPEEFAWTSTLTSPMTKKYGPVMAGIWIGLVWGIWHIIPWSWAHPAWWIGGMLLLNLLFRVFMVFLYEFGGRSLFPSLLFHMMINVCTGLFPNNGSHFNPWIFCVGFIAVVGTQIGYFGQAHNKKTGNWL